MQLDQEIVDRMRFSGVSLRKISAEIGDGQRDGVCGALPGTFAEKTAKKRLETLRCQHSGVI